MKHLFGLLIALFLLSSCATQMPLAEVPVVAESAPLIIEEDIALFSIPVIEDRVEEEPTIELALEDISDFDFTDEDRTNSDVDYSAEDSTSPDVDYFSVPVLAEDVPIATIPEEAPVSSPSLDEPLITLLFALDGESVTTRPTNLTRILTRALTSYSGSDFTIIHGGEVYGSLPAGAITQRDVLASFPSEHRLVVLEMSGSDVYRWMEHGYQSLPKAFAGFAQSDLAVVYNRFAEVGKRIIRLLINGQELDRAALYRVTTTDFLANGGQGYPRVGTPAGDGELLRDLVSAYLSSVDGATLAY
ncbi:MAG: 5'-nucleotidase [Sphaerochaeta sp.]